MSDIKSKRCVIVGGAEINNYNEVRKYLKKNDYIIFCDCGLRHAEKLNVEPSLIIGDFDSFEKPDTDIETIVLPCEKDDTDTVFAVKEGIRRGFFDFLLFGVIGQRFDHTFGNISILQFLYSQGLCGKIVDDYSEIEIVGKKTTYIPDSFAYFSLLNITGVAHGVCIKNAKYPLENAEITCEYQYGVSNEILNGKIAEVSVSDGSLLLVKIR